MNARNTKGLKMMTKIHILTQINDIRSKINAAHRILSHYAHGALSDEIPEPKPFLDELENLDEQAECLCRNLATTLLKPVQSNDSPYIKDEHLHKESKHQGVIK